MSRSASRRFLAVTVLVVAAATGCASSVQVSEPSTRDSTTTSPQPSPGNASGSVSLVAVGDIACDPTSPFVLVPGLCQSDRVADRVGELVDAGANWFIPLGDIQYETGGYQAYEQVYDKEFGRFRHITKPVAGNHEWYSAGANGYFRYFGRSAGTPQVPWRSFEPMPGWQVLLLDSNCEFVGGCGPGSAQGRWIRQTLTASSAPCVVAAWHHPLRTSGEYAGVTDSSDRAEQLWQSVEPGGVDIVLNGHDHIYERFRKFDGVQQFTVGTGGKSHYDITTQTPGSLKLIGGDYGVLQLTLRNDESYRYEFVTPGGNVLDVGNETCTNEPTS